MTERILIAILAALNGATAAILGFEAELPRLLLIVWAIVNGAAAAGLAAYLRRTP